MVQVSGFDVMESNMRSLEQNVLNSIAVAARANIGLRTLFAFHTITFALLTISDFKRSHGFDRVFHSSILLLSEPIVAHFKRAQFMV